VNIKKSRTSTTNFSVNATSGYVPLLYTPSAGLIQQLVNFLTAVTHIGADPY